MKEQKRECEVCGAVFITAHAGKKLCPECTDALHHGKGRGLPKTYDTPADTESYEQKLRKRNIEKYRDTIVAIGYADRQRANTLCMVGKVRTEL